MKVRILMATLVVTLLLGVRGYANPCDSACVDPCGACDRYAARGGDLFSGLKRLVNGIRVSNCSPCDAVLACNPCDEVTSGPCDEVCSPRPALGGRLRNLLASPLCTPCDGAADCGPCDGVVDCNPCGEIDFCGPRKFSLRNLNPFRNVSFGRGCYTDCDPCSEAGNCFDTNCGPCDEVCGDDYCGPRGHLIDLPRLNLSRLFNGLRVARCNAGDCGPCDEVQPCDGVCCR